MVALEWTDVEPLIGCKVSDYIIQHKRVEDPSEAEVYTGRGRIQLPLCLPHAAQNNTFPLPNLSESMFSGGLMSQKSQREQRGPGFGPDTAHAEGERDAQTRHEG